MYANKDGKQVEDCCHSSEREELSNMEDTVLNGSHERRIIEHCGWHSQAAPGQESDRYAKFLTRRDQALATIVLSAELSLLYLVGDPEDLATVWGKLANQFQKRMWADKLELRRNPFSLRLKNGESMQEHIHVKAVTTIFDGLSVIGDPISDEGPVVQFANQSARLIQHAGYSY